MNQRLKVLFLPEWYPNHMDPQLGVFVEKYARAVSAFCDVAVIYVYPSDVADSKLEIQKKDFLEVKITYPKKKMTLLAARAYINHHKKAKELLYAEWGKPDLVHLHMLFRNFIAWDELYRWDCPNFVLTEQWSGYLNGTYEALPAIKKKYFKQAFAQAKAISAVSEKLKGSLSELFGRNDIEVIPNIAEKSELKRFTTGKTQILVVADLVDDIKNISGIIDAYTQFVSKNDSELVIVGDGLDRKALETKALSCTNNKKKIIFKGRLSNPEVLVEMKKSSFLIINSNFETFSMVAAEALLSGMPVISSKCGGPEEFINEKNGILINKNNSVELAAAIEIMESTFGNYNPDDLANSVLTRFGMKTIGARMTDFYKR